MLVRHSEGIAQENPTKNGQKITCLHNAGITLIALIITIILLLILAGVTINLFLGENGIINKTRYAKDKYEEEQEKEQNELEKLYSSMLIATNDNSQITISVEDLNKIIDEKVDNIIEERMREGIVGINSNCLLMNSSNSSLNTGTLWLNSFSNSFGTSFSKYFEYNSSNGEITCLKNGWYMMYMAVNCAGYTDGWSTTTARLYINNIDVSKVYSATGSDSVNNDDNTNISIYLKEGDKILVSKVTEKSNLNNRNNVYFKIFKI